MTKKEAFRLLDLPETTSLAEIKKRYKALCVGCHPDATKGNTASLFRFVQEAYEILTGKQQPDAPPAPKVIRR